MAVNKKIDLSRVAPFIEALGHENEEVRQLAIQALGALAEVVAVNPLIQLLEDSDLETQKLTRRALASIREKASRVEDDYRFLSEQIYKWGDQLIASFIKALWDEDDRVGEFAAWSLGVIKKTEGIEPLVHALRLKSENNRTQEMIVWALREMGNAAVPYLIRALHHKESEVLGVLAWALGSIGDPLAVEPLIQELSSEYEEVRENAAWALGSIGDPRAVEPLIKVLDDTSPRVRENTAWALGTIADPQAIAPLRQMQNDPDVEVRERVDWAIDTIEEL